MCNDAALNDKYRWFCLERLMAHASIGEMLTLAQTPPAAAQSLPDTHTACSQGVQLCAVHLLLPQLIAQLVGFGQSMLSVLPLSLDISLLAPYLVQPVMTVMLMQSRTSRA